jgi:hypothetical protein
LCKEQVDELPEFRVEAEKQMFRMIDDRYDESEGKEKALTSLEEAYISSSP